MVQVVTTLLPRNASYQRLRVEKTEQDSVGRIIKKQREEDKYLYIEEWRLELEEKMAEKGEQQKDMLEFPNVFHTSTHDDPFRPDICHNSNSTRCTLRCLFKKHLLINHGQYYHGCSEYSQDWLHALLSASMLLLTVTCLLNNHTRLGSQYSMNRSFGKGAAHAKAFANFCLAKRLRNTYNHLSWWPLHMMAWWLPRQSRENKLITVPQQPIMRAIKLHASIPKLQ